MRFHFTEEQEAFRREVREFLREERDAGTFAPDVGELVGRPSLEFSRKLAKRGWIGMTNKLSPKVLAREAAYWGKMKKVLNANPGKGCHK